MPCRNPNQKAVMRRPMPKARSVRVARMSTTPIEPASCNRLQIDADATSRLRAGDDRHQIRSGAIGIEASPCEIARQLRVLLEDSAHAFLHSLGRYLFHFREQTRPPALLEPPAGTQVLTVSVDRGPQLLHALPRAGGGRDDGGRPFQG